jgi:hypothetical protein
MSGGFAKEIFLGNGFGEVAVKVNGATVEVHADGSVAAHTSGEVDAYTNASVRVHPADEQRPSESSVLPFPKPGDWMQDGTIYAGISPDTGRPMYTTPADAPLTYSFNQARHYASRLDAHGHLDWRVPTKVELNVLFNSRGAIGGFSGHWHWRRRAAMHLRESILPCIR